MRLREHFNQMWHILARHSFYPTLPIIIFDGIFYEIFDTHTENEIWIGNFDLYDLFRMCVPCECMWREWTCVLRIEARIIHVCKWFFRRCHCESETWGGWKILYLITVLTLLQDKKKQRASMPVSTLCVDAHRWDEQKKKRKLCYALRCERRKTTTTARKLFRDVYQKIINYFTDIYSMRLLERACDWV